jgi:hypothetical protein
MSDETHPVVIVWMITTGFFACEPRFRCSEPVSGRGGAPARFEGRVYAVRLRPGQAAWSSGVRWPAGVQVPSGSLLRFRVGRRLGGSPFAPSRVSAQVASLRVFAWWSWKAPPRRVSRRRCPRIVRNPTLRPTPASACSRAIPDYAATLIQNKPGPAGRTVFTVPITVTGGEALIVDVTSRSLSPFAGRSGSLSGKPGGRLRRGRCGPQTGTSFAKPGRDPTADNQISSARRRPRLPGTAALPGPADGRLRSGTGPAW